MYEPNEIHSVERKCLWTLRSSTTNTESICTPRNYFESAISRTGWPICRCIYFFPTIRQFSANMSNQTCSTPSSKSFTKLEIDKIVSSACGVTNLSSSCPVLSSTIDDPKVGVTQRSCCVCRNWPIFWAYLKKKKPKFYTYWMTFYMKIHLRFVCCDNCIRECAYIV